MKERTNTRAPVVPVASVAVGSSGAGGTSETLFSRRSLRSWDTGIAFWAGGACGADRARTAVADGGNGELIGRLDRERARLIDPDDAAHRPTHAATSRMTMGCALTGAQSSVPL